MKSKPVIKRAWSCVRERRLPDTFRALMTSRDVRGTLFPRGQAFLPVAGGHGLRISNYWRRYYSKDYEQDVARAFLDAAADCRVFFDGGAHVGFWSLFVHAAAPKGVTIAAFEPNPFARDWLDLHFRMNGIGSPSRIEACALDDKGGKARFNFSGSCTTGSISREVCDVYRDSDNTAVETREVDLISLDDHVRQTGLVPSLVKIDCEGYERRILRGASRTLADLHPRLIVEVHPWQMGLLGDSEESLENELHRHSYDLEVISRQTNGIFTILAK